MRKFEKFVDSKGLSETRKEKEEEEEEKKPKAVQRSHKPNNQIEMSSSKPQKKKKKKKKKKRKKKKVLKPKPKKREREKKESIIPLEKESLPSSVDVEVTEVIENYIDPPKNDTDTIMKDSSSSDTDDSESDTDRNVNEGSMQPQTQKMITGKKRKRSDSKDNDNLKPKVPVEEEEEEEEEEPPRKKIRKSRKKKKGGKKKKKKKKKKSINKPKNCCISESMNKEFIEANGINIEQLEEGVLDKIRMDINDMALEFQRRVQGNTEKLKKKTLSSGVAIQTLGETVFEKYTNTPQILTHPLVQAGFVSPDIFCTEE
jgi:hypothetical protein